MLKIAQDQTYRGEDWWDWSVWLDGPPAEMDSVEKVLWRLHPTFSPPTVTTTDRSAAFRLRTSGWGTFAIHAAVTLRGGEERLLKHELELLYPDGGEQPPQTAKAKGSERDVDAYVLDLDVPPSPAVPRDAAYHEGQSRLFHAGPQVLVVKSHLIEFSASVPEALRPVVSHGLLLGQLAADKATDGETDPWKWYETYNKVMTQIGWMLQRVGHERLTVPGGSAELYRAIIPILAAALGPKATVGSHLLPMLSDLSAVADDEPWLTLFQSRTTNRHGARFCLSYVDSAQDGGVSLKSIFFNVEAARQVTQVLFFKASTEQATVNSVTDEMTLSDSLISITRGALAKKVGPFVLSNIVSVD